MTTEQILDEARRVLLVESTVIADASSKLDRSFKDAIDILDSATQVVVIGVGKSGLIAQKIAATFSSTGKASFFLHPTEAMHGDLGTVTSGSAAILISKSGTSSELVALLPFLKQRSIPLIGMLGQKVSYLASQVDVLLDLSIEREACSFNIVPSASTSLALAMGDALAIVLMKLRDFSPADFAHNHPHGQLGKNLNLRVADVMHSGERIPIVQPGASFRSALIESSKKSLGCVCVCDDKQHLCGLITDGDVRRVLQTHDDIRSLIVDEVMTTKPLCVQEDVLLQEALGLMEQGAKQLSVLAVVDSQHRCLGVIRVHDIIRGAQD